MVNKAKPKNKLTSKGDRYKYLSIKSMKPILNMIIMIDAAIAGNKSNIDLRYKVATNTSFLKLTVGMRTSKSRAPNNIKVDLM
jgi:hypothetical protein